MTPTKVIDYYSGGPGPDQDADSFVAAAGYESASQNRGSHATDGSWLRRQVSKLTHGSSSSSSSSSSVVDRPKEASVNKWMDRHASRMLDPMDARASFVSSVASGLGPVPSVSPASVVPDKRETILSEMGQIRRAAVPPPLDVGMVERARRMHEEQQAQTQQGTGGERQREIDRAMELLDPPPPVAAGTSFYNGGGYSPARTEGTWKTWGVEQNGARR